MVVYACNPSYSGDWGRRIACTWEAEVAASQECPTALQSGQQYKTLPEKKLKSDLNNENAESKDSHVLKDSCVNGLGDFIEK